MMVGQVVMKTVVSRWLIVVDEYQHSTTNNARYTDCALALPPLCRASAR